MAPQVIRAATYLSPGIPVEFFQAVLDYLEQRLDVHTTLIYESRWFGPPADRRDPFAHGDIDIAFMSPLAFVRMHDAGNEHIELLPVSSVHQHLKGGDDTGHFADVIINADLKAANVDSFEKLRGCRWAYTGPESFSGNQITLQVLKRRGETATFFGNKLRSKSHLDSIYMVLNKQVDAAAVDANCLALFFDRNPSYKDKVFVIESWGSLPPYPIVVRKALPQETKLALKDALLEMSEFSEGAKQLAQYRVKRFAPVSMDQFLTFKEDVRETSKLTFDSVYY
uniref:Putative abc transporter n=1 Tax=Rhipicephalus pulchellus TaxID=72859 RepID=L7M580_RHIPC